MNLDDLADVSPAIVLLLAKAAQAVMAGRMEEAEALIDEAYFLRDIFTLALGPEGMDA